MMSLLREDFKGGTYQWRSYSAAFSYQTSPCPSSALPLDGLPIGRLGVLLKNCPRKQKDRVREFHSDFSPVAALLGETLSNEQVPTVQPVDAPLCLISRFRDNIYLLLCNVPAQSLPQVKQALSALLRVMYGIRLKVGATRCIRCMGGRQGFETRWNLSPTTAEGLNPVTE